MSSITHVGKKTRSFDSSPQFDGYSKVVITVSEDVEYTAGTDTGRTLTLTCPWGTQAMAEDILATIRGFKYQPYTATDSLLDPAAELGDGVTVNDMYSGIYTMENRFGALYRSTISAPSEEELDHEYPYIPQQERKVTRKLYQLSSELKVQAGEISAKVSRTGGEASSFGWVLDDSSWTIKASGMDILKATKAGLEVSGKITATSGKIGGFDIQSNYLSYNGQTWLGTNTVGGYFGVNGIQMGKNFRVDMAGNLYAASGEFSGSVKAGNIQYGGDNGTLPGAALTENSVYGGSGGAIRGGSITTFNTGSAINTTLGYADFANGVFNGWNKAAYLYVTSLHATRIYLGEDQYTVSPETATYLDGDGVTRTLYYVGWRRT